MRKVAKTSLLRSVRSALGTATPSPSQWIPATPGSAEHAVVREPLIALLHGFTRVASFLFQLNSACPGHTYLHLLHTHEPSANTLPNPRSSLFCTLRAGEQSPSLCSHGRATAEGNERQSRSRTGVRQTETQHRFIRTVLPIHRHIPSLAFRANHLGKGGRFRLRQNTSSSEQLKRVCRQCCRHSSINRAGHHAICPSATPTG